MLQWINKIFKRNNAKAVRLVPPDQIRNQIILFNEDINSNKRYLSLQTLIYSIGHGVSEDFVKKKDFEDMVRKIVKEELDKMKQE